MPKTTESSQGVCSSASKPNIAPFIVGVVSKTSDSLQCSKLMTKRLHSFKKRNKSRLEAAAILTAQKKAQMAASGELLLS